MTASCVLFPVLEEREVGRRKGDVGDAGEGGGRSKVTDLTRSALTNGDRGLMKGDRVPLPERARAELRASDVGDTVRDLPLTIGEVTEVMDSVPVMAEAAEAALALLFGDDILRDRVRGRVAEGASGAAGAGTWTHFLLGSGATRKSTT